MPTFPAFEDEEPPPRSLTGRVLRAGVVVGLLALGATAVLAAAGILDRDEPSRLTATPTPGTKPSREGPPAGILYVDSERLSVADPDGGRPQPVSGPFPTSQQRFGLAVSPDRRAAVTEDGFLVPLDRAGIVTPQRVVPADLTGFTVQRGAWSADGAALAIDLHPAGGPGRVGLLTLATGAMTTLAEGANAAGDPRTPGAAYVTGIVGRGTPEQPFADADRVERRAAGAPPVTMLTRADFLRLMGVKAGTPTDFFDLTWSPDGELLALTGVAMTNDPGPYGPRGRWGVAVISRIGEVKAFQALPALHFVGSLAWSPGAGQLVYSDFHEPSRLTRPTTEIRSWTPATGVLTTLKVPQGEQPFGHGDCLFSPDGARLLCGDDRAWYVIAISGGTSTVAETVPGRPSAWLGT